MDLREIIAEIEAAGGILTLDGVSIKYEVPALMKPHLAELRAKKSEAVRILGERQKAAHAKACPNLPNGVRLIRYEPKEPPVLIESYAVVVDIPKFVDNELRELDGRLHAPIQVRGGFGIFTILDWLAQCGMELEIVQKFRGARP